MAYNALARQVTPDVAGSYMSGLMQPRNALAQMQRERLYDNALASLAGYGIDPQQTSTEPTATPGNGYGIEPGAIDQATPTRPEARPSGSQGAGGDYIRYANDGAIRSLPLSDQLTSALSFLPEMGVEMEVFSGGQAEKGSGGPRTGSTRHDHGNAADVFFYRNGRRLSWENPDDVPVLQEIVRRGKQSGVTGFGAGEGYMQPGSMHIGFGTPAVWGRGGSGDNAPEWLRQAYYG